ncbi:MAG TPA: carboxypeptidase regulatory-like domain-containing protein [Terriglobales bacterium]|nr:carboxypeptidase regulatory-like domain-containing protein [Terriglobales bacterium]
MTTLPLLIGQTSTGSMRGVVQDSSGARLPHAEVVARARGSAFERRVTADDRGEFRLLDLLPGDYRLTVSAPGFAEAHADVELIVSSVRDYVITMKPGGGQETVRVESQASSITTQSIDLASAVHQTAVMSQDLQALPLSARSFANIAYLAPGTEPVEPSDPTKARITAVSTGGSSGLNNALSVDGVDNSDDWIGGFLQNFSPDAIQEFSVQTAQEDADTGGTTAGSVVITTKRGTDDWHGTFAFFDRQAALNARFPIENPAPNPKQPFSRQNYVGAIGGPIKKDKLWFFAAFEHVHENASIAYSDASLTQFDALSTLASEALIPGVSSIPVPTFVPIPFRDYNGSVRFDWTQSPKSQWFLRVSGDSYLTHNALVQQATLPSTGLTTHNNYWNGAIVNSYTFSSTWLATFAFGASELHLTQARNSDFGFALAFPFSATSLTVSGFETFGDNQFATPITLFPDLRNQEKYQFRYDVTHTAGRHAPKFGINFIHEPVLSGAFPGNNETLYKFPQNPTFYLTQPGSVFTADMQAGASTSNLGGSFSQNIQRLALYAEDSWHVTPQLTLNYGLRYQTSFGLFDGSGRSQLDNPAYLTLQALGIPLQQGAPHDYRKQFGPRLGIAYSVGRNARTVIRAGFGMYYDDLAQNGWATAFQSVNQPVGPCRFNNVPGHYALTGPGCILGGAGAGGNLIASGYKTPYNIHVTGGVQHAFNPKWALSADYTHEEGNHGYRGYTYSSGVNLFTPLIPTTDPNYAADQASVVPNLNLFKSDNRSSYNALMVHLQGNMSRRFSLIANYTLSRAETWGCVLGELFDYVNGVCNPLNPFGPGDYGPSGENVTHRFVLAGTLHLPGGFEVTTLTQAESARPLTITTADNSQRIAVNGVPTSLDEFRGTPYIQADLRVSRPFNFHDRWSVIPFVEFFNLFNRNNPGANYIGNVSTLPVPLANQQSGNVTAICTNPACTASKPVTSLQQLAIPAGALGDFFGPGTTVGIPFAAQIGARVTF